MSDVMQKTSRNFVLQLAERIAICSEILSIRAEKRKDKPKQERVEEVEPIRVSNR